MKLKCGVHVYGGGKNYRSYCGCFVFFRLLECVVVVVVVVVVMENRLLKSTTKFRALLQGGSNMTGTDLCVNKPHCAAAVRP